MRKSSPQMKKQKRISETVLPARLCHRPPRKRQAESAAGSARGHVASPPVRGAGACVRAVWGPPLRSAGGGTAGGRSTPGRVRWARRARAAVCSTLFIAVNQRFPGEGLHVVHAVSSVAIGLHCEEAWITVHLLGARTAAVVSTEPPMQGARVPSGAGGHQPRERRARELSSSSWKGTEERLSMSGRGAGLRDPAWPGQRLQRRLAKIAFGAASPGNIRCLEPPGPVCHFRIKI